MEKAVKVDGKTVAVFPESEHQEALIATLVSNMEYDSTELGFDTIEVTEKK